MNPLSWLVTIDHPNPTVARRGKMLATILAAIIVMLLLAVPIGLVTPDPLTSLGSLLAALVVEIIALWLARSGRVALAAWLFIFASAAALIGTVTQIQFPTPLIPLFFLSLIVVAAGAVLPPRHAWAVLAVCLIACAIGLAITPGALRDLGMLVTTACAAIILIATAVISYLGADAIQKALAMSEASAQAARQAREAAESHARDIEAQAEDLRHTEQQLYDLVATLETPTIALAEGILLASIIGALDSRRVGNLTQRLLQDVAARRVRLLVLDVAGVALIDTAIAQALTRIVDAVRLLGCDVVITGITPSVALTLTHQGINFAGIQTARSPQEVLTTHTVGVEAYAA